MAQRRTIRVHGVVQGVGFRPFIYGLAGRFGLRGRVWNDRAGAIVDVEGEAETLDRFYDQLLEDARAPILIERTHADSVPLKGYSSFAIGDSDRQTAGHVIVSPDRTVCEECLRELHDPSNRRYRYPFINCTNCGPRFTIVIDVPYDRERTTMAGFSMCPSCRSEYLNPTDRRFHAQPIACAACGPRLSLLDAHGIAVAADDLLTTAVRALRNGRVVAIKGLGGYHLACDARNRAAVLELRRRKGRDAKALAIMVGDQEAARSYCHIVPAEEQLLTSAERPIVLLRKKEGMTLQDVAPGNACIGVMLAYTPLHHLLLKEVGGPLIMTSGNRKDEPIAYRDDDAVSRLSGLADLFLVHDRPIHTRCDDSVMRVVRDRPLPLRRSRGYAPLSIMLPQPVPRPILACGGHQKNVFCLAEGNRAVLSQHQGELEDIESFRAFSDSVDHFQHLFGIRPQLVAHDLHPDYRSTRFAQSFTQLPRIAVQHHHAHIAACMAEHQVDGPVIGVAFDGTGYGSDGSLWGGEFLLADYAGFERAAHLEECPLPGGEQAVRHPWRIAAGLLFQHYGQSMDELDLDFVMQLDARGWPIIRKMLAARLNTPCTSSAGRLFDAIAALIGLRHDVSYEAQAAIELEALAGREPARMRYPFELRGETPGFPLRVSIGGIIRGVVEDLKRSQAPATIADRFHSTLAQMVCATCRHLRSLSGIEQVALSGGVFQNARFLSETTDGLQAEGFRVYRHQRVPPNDGGLALGQAAVAAAVCRAANGADPARERRVQSGFGISLTS